MDVYSKVPGLIGTHQRCKKDLKTVAHDYEQCWIVLDVRIAL